MSATATTKAAWHLRTTKPKRNGVYEVLASDGRLWWSMFKNGKWHGHWTTKERASSIGAEMLPSGLYSDDKWR